MAPQLTAQDKKWQRQDDARILAMAQEIIANKTRHNGAIKEAKIMVKESDKRAAAMKKVATKKTIKRKTKSTKNKIKKAR